MGLLRSSVALTQNVRLQYAHISKIILYLLLCTRKQTVLLDSAISIFASSAPNSISYHVHGSALHFPVEFLRLSILQDATYRARFDTAVVFELTNCRTAHRVVRWFVTILRERTNSTLDLEFPFGAKLDHIATVMYSTISLPNVKQ